MAEMRPHQPEEEEASPASPKTQPPIQLSASSDSEADSSPSSPSSKQLLLYDPHANGTAAAGSDIQPISMVPPVRSGSRSRPRPGFLSSSRMLPSVGAFTVQCAGCFKWRLIPTKEKYEEIREHILENPFYCETAREWRPDVSCDDPPDISQDGSRVWAIDKPNIALPPPGWQRLLRIRGEGSTKFADVYYVAPSGKRFRSMVEVQKYLIEHPEYIRSGVTMSQFSFLIPKPLQENYVRKKRPAHLKDSFDHASKAKPLSWASPDDRLTLRLPPPSSFEDDPLGEPVQKQARRTSIK